LSGGVSADDMECLVPVGLPWDSIFHQLSQRCPALQNRHIPPI
jgi:hypothetical protein